MKIKEIQNLIKFVAKSGAQEVKLEMEDVKITIKTGSFPSQIESGGLVQQIQAVPTPIVSQIPVQTTPITQQEPTKNEEKNILNAIRGLQNLRKEKLCEIILVDGMSIDRTIEIACQYVDKIIISEPNRGMQMNKGAEIAIGETLLFLHADTDISKNNCISILSKYIYFSYLFIFINFPTIF